MPADVHYHGNGKRAEGETAEQEGNGGAVCVLGRGESHDFRPGDCPGRNQRDVVPPETKGLPLPQAHPFKQRHDQQQQDERGTLRRAFDHGKRGEHEQGNQQEGRETEDRFEDVGEENHGRRLQMKRDRCQTAEAEEVGVRVDAIEKVQRVALDLPVEKHPERGHEDHRCQVHRHIRAHHRHK